MILNYLICTMKKIMHPFMLVDYTIINTFIRFMMMFKVLKNEMIEVIQNTSLACSRLLFELSKMDPVSCGLFFSSIYSQQSNVMSPSNYSKFHYYCVSQSWMISRAWSKVIPLRKASDTIAIGIIMFDVIQAKIAL